VGVFKPWVLFFIVMPCLLLFFVCQAGQVEGSNEVKWYLNLLLTKYVSNANPHVRQAACIWMLALVKKCCSHDALQGRLSDLQGAFMKLLSESDGKVTGRHSHGPMDIIHRVLWMSFTEPCSNTFLF
jgi:hypothetical protein